MIHPPRGTPLREEVWPGLCVRPVSAGGAGCPRARESRPQEPGGPLSCVRPYVGVGSGAGCLCLVCDPALEGSCPVSPEGATTKVAGRWWGRRLDGPARPPGSQPLLGLSRGTGRPALLPSPSHCRQPFCFPNALCLGTLPQNMQYVWVTRPAPTPPPRAAPGPQRLRLPRPPFRPCCLSVFTLRMASNKYCPWRPASGSAASVLMYPETCQDRATCWPAHTPLRTVCPRRGLQTH